MIRSPSIKYIFCIHTLSKEKKSLDVCIFILISFAFLLFFIFCHYFKSKENELEVHVMYEFSLGMLLTRGKLVQQLNAVQKYLFIFHIS